MATETETGAPREAGEPRGLFYRFRRNLAELLDPEAEKAAPARSAGLGGANADGGFEERLRTLLAQGGPAAVQAGRINFIGLDKVRDRYGAGWEKVAARADRIARQTIERHLAQCDLYTGLPGFAYVIFFTRLSHEEARVKCRVITERIVKLLLGEAGTDLLEIKTAVARIDGRIDLSSSALTEEVMSTLSGARESAERDRPEPESRAPTTDGTRDLLDRLSFAYRPVWDKTRSVVSAYSCMARVSVSHHGAATEDAAAMIGDQPRERERLDGLVQQRVLADLDELVRGGRRAFLVMPVHFETLARPAARRDFIAGLEARVTVESRKRLLIEVDGAPRGVVQSRLTEIVTPLRPVCRGVMLRLPLDTADLSPMKDCGAFGVGADLDARTEAEFTLMMWMNRFARSAEKAGMETYLHGLRSLSQVAAAIGAGFGYLDGDIVAKPVDHSRNVVEFHLDDLYRPFLRG
jgi:EAL domain-containing protein (putative c-di-GMP-specific phosphodiesterase class I)